jgi:hypothetical protein
VLDGEEYICEEEGDPDGDPGDDEPVLLPGDSGEERDGEPGGRGEVLSLFALFFSFFNWEERFLVRWRLGDCPPRAAASSAASPWYTLLDCCYKHHI